MAQSSNDFQLGRVAPLLQHQPAEAEIMTITLTGLLILLLVAGICGAIGRAMGGGAPGGFLVSVAVGFVGAFLGVLIANAAKLPELVSVSVDGRPFPILWSIIGGALLVALANMFTRRTVIDRWRYR
jgi:uncharacterized membrane protein YeaQ/YmgE (transglycosylase-associated protein family)